MSKRGKAHERRQAAMLAALPPPAPGPETCYSDADFGEHADVYRCLLEELPFCGCGDVEGRIQIFRTILLWRSAPAAMPGMTMWRDNGPRQAMMEILLLVLDDAGLLEHGSNVFGSFLTGRGEKVLAFLKLHGCDPDTWPGDHAEGVVGPVRFSEPGS